MRWGHSFGVMRDFLPFDAVVPLKRSSGFYERRLQEVLNPSLRGVALTGKSIRTITDAEFAAIVHDGLRDTLSGKNVIRLGLDDGHVDVATRELIVAPVEEQERLIGQSLVDRPVRDAAFRRAVLDAYDNQCAVAGLRIVNGGGSARIACATIVKSGLLSGLGSAPRSSSPPSGPNGLLRKRVSPDGRTQRMMIYFSNGSTSTMHPSDRTH